MTTQQKPTEGSPQAHDRQRFGDLIAAKLEEYPEGNDRKFATKTFARLAILAAHGEWRTDEMMANVNLPVAMAQLRDALGRSTTLAQIGERFKAVETVEEFSRETIQKAPSRENLKAKVAIRLSKGRDSVSWQEVADEANGPFREYYKGQAALFLELLDQEMTATGIGMKTLPEIKVARTAELPELKAKEVGAKMRLAATYLSSAAQLLAGSAASYGASPEDRAEAEEAILKAKYASEDAEKRAMGLREVRPGMVGRRSVIDVKEHRESMEAPLKALSDSAAEVIAIAEKFRDQKAKSAAEASQSHSAATLSSVTAYFNAEDALTRKISKDMRADAEKPESPTDVKVLNRGASTQRAYSQTGPIGIVVYSPEETGREVTHLVVISRKDFLAQSSSAGETEHAEAVLERVDGSARSRFLADRDARTRAARSNSDDGEEAKRISQLAWRTPELYVVNVEAYRTMMAGLRAGRADVRLVGIEPLLDSERWIGPEERTSNIPETALKSLIAKMIALDTGKKVAEVEAGIDKVTPDLVERAGLRATPAKSGSGAGGSKSIEAALAGTIGMSERELMKEAGMSDMQISQALGEVDAEGKPITTQAPAPKTADAEADRSGFLGGLLSLKKKHHAPAQEPKAIPRWDLVETYRDRVLVANELRIGPHSEHSKRLGIPQEADSVTMLLEHRRKLKDWKAEHGKFDSKKFAKEGIPQWRYMTADGNHKRGARSFPFIEELTMGEKLDTDSLRKIGVLPPEEPPGPVDFKITSQKTSKGDHALFIAQQNIGPRLRIVPQVKITDDPLGWRKEEVQGLEFK